MFYSVKEVVVGMWPMTWLFAECTTPFTLLIMQMLFCWVECAFICATCAGLMILCCVCCCCGSIHQIRVFGIYVMCCCCTKVMFGKIIRTTNFNMFWTYHLSSVISFEYRVFRWFVSNVWKISYPLVNVWYINTGKGHDRGKFETYQMSSLSKDVMS